MKKKKIFRSLVLSTVIASMIITTVGCGAKKETTGTKTLPDINIMKFETPIEVVTAKTVYDVKIYPEGQSPDSNDVYKSIESVMGIKLTNKYAVPFDAYKQKIKLSMVSKDLPDIFYVDENDLQEMIKGDQLEDMKPYYEKYASENLKKIMGFKDSVAFKTVDRGGKYYGIPNVADAMNGVPVLWIRKDWMDSLGLKAPKTADELFVMAKAFGTQDPDKNGKADTYGLALNKELDLRFTGIANLLGAYPSIYTKDSNGKYVFGSVDPKIKDVLTKFNELYKVGAIDPEFATKDMTKVAETLAQGKIGMYVGEFYQPLWPLGDTLKNVKGADWIGVPMPGEQFIPQTPLHVTGAYVVRKGFAHPEALIVMLNNIAEAGYETKGNAWSDEWVKLSTKYANNGVNNWLPIMLDRPDANAAKLIAFKEVDKTNDTSKLTPNYKNLYDMIQKAKAGDASVWGWPKVYYEGVESALSYKKSVYNEWFQAPTETAKMKSASLIKLEKETFINIIVGNKPVSDFDSYVTQWKAQGGDQILKEMSEAK